MAGMTQGTTRKAIALRHQWRDNGTPSMVTAHEAWKLTEGVVGTEGDHETPMSLAAVALLATRKR